MASGPKAQRQAYKTRGSFSEAVVDRLSTSIGLLCPLRRATTTSRISTNITRGSPHPGHGGSRPRAPFTGVKPNIYEYIRTKCGRIDLVRAHLIRYRTHIQHTRAIEYSFLSAVVPPSSAAALLSPARRWSQLLTHTPAARIPTCPGRLLVRADAFVPPAHP